MRDTNEMELIFDSISVNEGFARVAVAAFMTQLNPTLEEVADVKTAVSEAVTNAIIHGYEKEVKKIRAKDLAKKIAFVAQNTNIDYEFTVEDLKNLMKYSK